MHTIKGSAAQVGLHRIAHVAHRAEDLIGRLRNGELQPSAEIIDICLDAVDALKKFLYRQWDNEASMQASVQTLFSRITHLAPQEPVSASEPEPVPAENFMELHLEEPALHDAAVPTVHELEPAPSTLHPVATARLC